MTVSWEIRQGDALERLRELPDRSVQMCWTSPPYFGLRDYGTAAWEGGDGSCDHGAERIARRQADKQSGLDGGTPGSLRDRPTAICVCGARRIDRQVGLEPTPDEYVARLVEVFREVHRVLRDDGTVWLNPGDSYAANSAGANGYRDGRGNREERTSSGVPPGLKSKDLIGVPWLVAFALRADGWYLRSDIVWSKPNPMPESVTDRPTKAHEYLFLFAKSPRYFYDGRAIAEVATGRVPGNLAHKKAAAYESGVEHHRTGGGLLKIGARTSRSRRTVWTIATQPFPGAHFAVCPPKLVEPCILAGSASQACAVCGAPWVRLAGRGKTRDVEPSCSHQDDSGTCTVLDPFCGAGTTGLVALRHGRSFLGVELNAEYVELARRRIVDDEPLFRYSQEAA